MVYMSVKVSHFRSIGISIRHEDGTDKLHDIHVVDHPDPEMPHQVGSEQEARHVFFAYYAEALQHGVQILIDGDAEGFKTFIDAVIADDPIRVQCLPCYYLNVEPFLDSRGVGSRAEFAGFKKPYNSASHQARYSAFAYFKAMRNLGMLELVGG